MSKYKFCPIIKDECKKEKCLAYSKELYKEHDYFGTPCFEYAYICNILNIILDTCMEE